MYLTFLFLPFLGAASAGLLGRKIGVTGAHIITTSCLAISAVLSIIAFYEVVLCHSPVTINLGSLRLCRSQRRRQTQYLPHPTI